MEIIADIRKNRPKLIAIECHKVQNSSAGWTLLHCLAANGFFDFIGADYQILPPFDGYALLIAKPPATRSLSGGGSL